MTVTDVLIAYAKLLALLGIMGGVVFAIACVRVQRF